MTSRGNGRDVVRGGWGVYHDFGYTNSNVLFPAIDATRHGLRRVFSVNNHGRHPQPRRHASSASASRSRTSRARTRRIPTCCRCSASSLDPRLEQPYHAAGVVRLVAPADASTVDHGRLRAHRRARSQHPLRALTSRSAASGLRRLADPRLSAERAGIRAGDQRRREHATTG